MIENALANAPKMSAEQHRIVSEMLSLAEAVGLEFDPQADPQADESDSEDNISDQEIDDIIAGLTDDDLMHAYDDDEFGIYNSETGERVDEGLDEAELESLNEVLSRMERIRSRLRMAKNKTKMQQKLKIALHKRSSTDTLKHRARRLAIKSLAQKIAKKPLNMLSTSEKERIERIVARRKRSLDRISMKLVPHVRQVEKDRLSHR